IIILGVSFSLVPAALWPSVPKVMDARYLGSAYSLIFWVQNIGLFGIPILFGRILETSNPGVTDPTQYDYTNPMLMFAGLGILAFICAVWLKMLNTRNHYGLEDPNILADDEAVRLDGEA
ncbi:MAG: MFS transporter, partial [Duncaniella sp.]|nr:MFS transporter [Duncaniella sp.]